MPLALTPAEILELTKPLTRPAAQLRHLRRMGIRAARRPDGSVLVLRAWLAERPESAAQSSPRPRLKSEREKTTSPRIPQARLALVR